VSDPDDDERWREIIDNYGDRAELTDAEFRTRQPIQPDPAPFEEAAPPREPEADRFVPPSPPPVPRPTPRRLAAWAGLLGAPLLLLASLVLGSGVPTPLSLVLVAWFVGGFVYLVLEMPRGPRDPDDDGARL
jgi:hypothetical protein